MKAFLQVPQIHIVCDKWCEGQDKNQSDYYFLFSIKQVILYFTCLY